MVGDQNISRPRIWMARPLFDDLLDPLRVHADVRVGTHWNAYDSAALAAELADVNAAIVSLDCRIDEAALASAPHLKVLANLGVGFNNLDLDALTRRGILACNTPDVLTETTADYAWALLLAAARRVAEGDRLVRAGKWRDARFDRLLGVDVHGRTLGILGMGRIGRAVARRAVGFGMQVLYHNRSRLDADTEAECSARYVDFDTLLRESDHLVLLLPYTPEVHHLIGADALSHMKRSAVLVNVARGGIVDEDALAGALAEGRLAAAGLDVFEGEPGAPHALCELSNVVLSPHLGSASTVTRRAMMALCVTHVRHALGLGLPARRPGAVLNQDVLSSFHFT